MSQQPNSAAPRLALFDLDGTLTWHDSLLPFLWGYLLRHPWRVLRLWRLPAALARYGLAGRDRGVLKAALIGMVMGGDARAEVDAWAQRFVAAMQGRGSFRAGALAALEAHRRAGDRLVLLSASPDLYVPLIGRLLGFERSVCTEVLWRDERLCGALRSANRHGPEKLRCLEALRRDFPGLPVTAYGNSASDLVHLEAAEHGVLVNGNGVARRAAWRAGLTVADWT